MLHCTIHAHFRRRALRTLKRRPPALPHPDVVGGRHEGLGARSHDCRLGLASPSHHLTVHGQKAPGHARHDNSFRCMARRRRILRCVRKRHTLAVHGAIKCGRRRGEERACGPESSRIYRRRMIPGMGPWRTNLRRDKDRAGARRRVAGTTLDLDLDLDLDTDFDLDLDTERYLYTVGRG